jgi:sugar/nucleoside kinase (ribokinase family)
MKNHSPKGVFIGRAVRDIIMPLDSRPDGFDDKVGYTDSITFIGGSGPNAAIAFGTLSQKGYRSRPGAFLYTAIGQTDNTVNSELSDHGVILRDCKPGDDFRLMDNFGWVVGRERLGARDLRPKSNVYDEWQIGLPEGLEGMLADDLAAADIGMIDGRYPALSEKFCDAARAARVPIVLDPGSWKTYTPDMINDSDLPIASHEFKPNGKKATPEEILEFLKSFGKSEIVVTRGHLPTLLYSGGKIKEVPIFNVDVVDTFAAGDLMHGAFCFFKAEGRSTFDAILNANKVASESIRYFGPREGIDRLEAVPSEAIPSLD